MQSPYEPPRAPVADPPAPAITPGARPLSVSLASLLLVLVAIYQIVRLMRASGFEAGVHVGWAVALTVVALMLERGRNGARWVLLGLAVLSSLTWIATLIAPMVAGVQYARSHAVLMRGLLAGLCVIMAALLVFGPGRAWFKVPR